MKLKILFLGDADNSVYTFLKERENVMSCCEPITFSLSPYDWIVSYGYRHILNQHQIDESCNPIINLHISYLPYNRGADPNYWSWVEDTPKGVTIHAIDQGIDTGDIYIQKLVTFSENETLTSSYTKLKNEIEVLFMNSFDKIVSGSMVPVPQTGEGSIHYVKQFPGLKSWDVRVKELVK